MADIFEDKTQMPPAQEEQCCRVAMTSRESRDAKLPGERPNPAMAIENIKRPRFGYGY